MANRVILESILLVDAAFADEYECEYEDLDAVVDDDDAIVVVVVLVLFDLKVTNIPIILSIAVVNNGTRDE